MFELTALAAGLVAVFTLFDYVVYFIIRPSTTVRVIIGLATLALFFYVMSGPYAKEVALPIARIVKEDLADETKPEAAIDFAGFTTIIALSYVLHWTMYARATGRPDSFGIMAGALLGLFALA
jgi:hypothetical protein